MTIMENGNYSLIPNYAFTAEMLSLKTQFWPRCIARCERWQPFLLKNQEFRVFLWICIHRSCCKWNIARWKLFKHCGYQRVGLHMFYVIVWNVVSVVWGNKRWHRVRWRFLREEDRVYRVQSCKSDFARQFLTYGTKGNLLLVSKEPLIVNLQNSFSIVISKVSLYFSSWGTVALLLNSLSLLQTLWFGYVFNFNFSCRVVETDVHLDDNSTNPKFFQLLIVGICCYLIYCFVQC